MKSQMPRPRCAFVQLVQQLCACAGLILLLTTPALGEMAFIPSFHTWQWNGFSRSSSVVVQETDTSISDRLAALETVTSVEEPSVSALMSSAFASILETSTATASLTGFVYVDADNDGTKDAAENAIMDAKVSLTRSGSSDSPVLVYSDKHGAYTFDDLAPGDYKITLLSSSNQPGKNALGSLSDEDGNEVTTGTGTVGVVSFASIHLANGYSGKNYNFAQLVYPISLLSARLTLNEDTGIRLKCLAVPEPSSLALLAIGGLFLGGLGWRRRAALIG